MRFIVVCLLLAASAVAQEPADKYRLPRSELDRRLNLGRDREIQKLESQAAELGEAIRDAAAKRLPKSRANDVQGFKLPLSRDDTYKAKTKVNELKATIATLKKARSVIPQVDVALERPPFGVCYLVECKANDKGERVAMPLVVKVTSTHNDRVYTSCEGKIVRINMDGSRVQVGDTITLDKPVEIDTLGDLNDVPMIGLLLFAGK